MEDVLILGMHYDDWMNAFAGSGILLLFGAYYLETRGKVRVGYATRTSKLIGFGFICVPLFLRWYLSGSFLLFASLVLIVVCCFFIYRRRRRI